MSAPKREVNAGPASSKRFPLSRVPARPRRAPVAGGRIHVVVAAAHRLFREGLRLCLRADDTIEIVGEAPQAAEILSVVGELKPDVVLVDATMCENDDFEVIRGMKRASPSTKPLILTSAGDEALIFKALKVGVKGCISKDTSRADLVKAIHALQRGEAWVSRTLMARFLEEGAAHSEKENGPNRAKVLTGREREVVRGLASGGTNKDIAQVLEISEKTVKSHLNNIFRKLSVTRRLEVALYAIREGLR